MEHKEIGSPATPADDQKLPLDMLQLLKGQPAERQSGRNFRVSCMEPGLHRLIDPIRLTCLKRKLRRASPSWFPFATGACWLHHSHFTAGRL